MALDALELGAILRTVFKVYRVVFCKGIVEFPIHIIIEVLISAENIT